jgi:hypothetical protein
MNTKTISLFSITTITLLILLTTVSTATMISSIPQHKGIVCIYCHETRGFSIGSEEDGGGCENCHILRDNKALLEQAHSKVCNACHGIPNSPEAYHQLHSVVACAKCHGNGTTEPIIKPSVSIADCGGCHGVTVSYTGGRGSIHDAHKPVLDKACPVCHGTRPDAPAPGTIQSPKNAIVSTVYAKLIDYRKYTLYEIFKKLSTIF